MRQREREKSIFETLLKVAQMLPRGLRSELESATDRERLSRRYFFNSLAPRLWS